SPEGPPHPAARPDASSIGTTTPPSSAALCAILPVPCFRKAGRYDGRTAGRLSFRRGDGMVPHNQTTRIFLTALLAPAGWGVLLPGTAAPAQGKGPLPARQMAVHVVQASGQSNYAFVRANFHPGEIDDPWAVRFLDPRGKEVPYFVWDAVDWQTARDGRPDWGRQYALLQHSRGNDPGAKQARAEKLAWAKQFLPAEAADLERHEQAARKSPQSQCVVLYLLRYRAAPYAKDRLTMQIFAQRQVSPTRQEFTNESKDEQSGDLALRGFPLRPEVTWKGKTLFRYAGFNAGQTQS